MTCDARPGGAPLEVRVEDGMLCFSDEQAFVDTMEGLVASRAEEQLDGGDTEGLLRYIASAPPPREMSQVLRDASPLSQRVLGALLDRVSSGGNRFEQGVKLGAAGEATHLLPVVADVFVHNAPFADAIRRRIERSDLPPRLVAKLLAVDDNVFVIPDPLLGGFEEGIGFFSARREIERLEDEFLRGGGDPSEGSPDRFFIASDFLRTVLNPSLEVRVGASILKFADDSTLLRFPADCPGCSTTCGRRSPSPSTGPPWIPSIRGSSRGSPWRCSAPERSSTRRPPPALPASSSIPRTRPSTSATSPRRRRVTPASSPINGTSATDRAPLRRTPCTPMPRPAPSW